jgi:predicted HAD superfamily Cof-like phosphohydrolase
LHPQQRGKINLILKQQTMSETTALKNKIDSVAEFHEAFLIGNRHAPTGQLDEKEFMLRFNLLKEENEEYLEACKRGDLVEIADALGDVLYIAFGTILRHGLQYKIEEVFDEIHRSNMSKLDANGKPIFREDGKVLKSENYFKPKIAAVLEK